MDPVRLLVVDDHALFREGLRALLVAYPDIQVVGEAENSEQAIQQVERLQPDVVLMDIAMPGTDGIEATRRLLRINPNLGVVIVTMVEQADSVFAAMRAGARGYVLKGSHHEEMLRAIHAVANGQAVFGSAIAARMMNYFQDLDSSSEPASADRPFPELTERERQVLELIARGTSNAQIAEELVISPKTVSNHITSIFSKLQIADRAQAIIRARDAGLG